MHSLQHLWKSVDDHNSNQLNMQKDVWTKFLQNFWKGITMPFPALCRIVVRPSEHNRNRKMAIGLSVREGLVLLAVYLCSGVLAYSIFFEHWSVVDALYFTCTTFSTVGYGDVCPKTVTSKIFTCLFGLGGIACLGAAVATVGGKIEKKRFAVLSWLYPLISLMCCIIVVFFSITKNKIGRFVQAEVEAMQRARKESRRRLMQLFEGMPKVLKHHRGRSRQERIQELQEAQSKLERSLNKSVPHRVVIQKALTSAFPSLTVILSGAAIVQYLNGNAWWSFDTVYLGLITASTIGLGDLSPQTRAARIFAIVYIPLAVAAAGEILSGIATALVHRRQRLVYARQLEHDLTIEHLQTMDVDGDGKISREEYIQFMLIEMGRVSADELDELASQFERLDIMRSGFLDKEDLKLMAELRGATVKHISLDESS